ncbi:TetR/AcrR family transcriptional regulator [Marinobacter hydrocarbonoclasticus]|nr:TetR/AcrR family transcriptional regulator [Marinobacter nauticus]
MTFQQLLADQDYCDISLSQILVRAEVSKTTFYRHFSNKLELFVAMHDRIIESLLSELNERSQWLAVGANAGVLSVSQQITSKASARRSMAHKLGNDWPLAQRMIKRQLCRGIERRLQQAFGKPQNDPVCAALGSPLAAVFLDYLGQLNHQLNGQPVELKATELQWVVRAIVAAAVAEQRL